MAHAGTPEQNRAVGFSDGCHNIIVPGHNTPEYREGFAAGQEQCQQSEPQGGVIGRPDMSSSSSSPSSSSATGNSLNIQITPK